MKTFKTSGLRVIALLGALGLCAACADDDNPGKDIDTVTDTESTTDTVVDSDSDTSTDTEHDPEVPSLEVGYSLLTVCLGVNHDYHDAFGGGHDIIVNPVEEQSLAYDWIRDSEIEKMGYAILNYTAVDPTTAPAGKNVICLSAMMMFDWQDEWQWSQGYETYEQFKHEIALILVERAENDALPGLSTHVEVMEVLSPQTMKGFTSNPKGSIFGWHMIPEQSMNNRLPAQTPIDNLILASAWTFPGGGQSAVVASGLFAGMTIMAKENGPSDEPVEIPEEETAGQNIIIFEALDIWDKVKPLRLDPMYRIMNPDGTPLDIPADADEYGDMLKQRFPEEVEGIDALWTKIRRIDRVLRIIFRFQNAGKDLYGADMADLLAAMTEAGLADELMTVQALMSGTTLTEFLADYISDPALISIFTQLSGFAGTGPDDVSAIFFVVMWASYHLGGYYYFEGGSQSVSDAMAQVIEENGGHLRLHTRAARIDIGQDGLAQRVVTDDGVCFGARYVVSNANAPSTLLDMVGAEYLPEDTDSPYHPDKLRWWQGEKKYPGKPLEKGPPQDMQIDAITGATPGVDSAVLTATSHPSGFGKAGCTSCHAAAHGNNLARYTDAQCTSCHGQNGSPTMPKGHALDNCSSCHASSHSGKGYVQPTDCRACHRYTPAAQNECSTTKNYDVVIIGAGGGGLAAGAYLARNGMSVVVLEQHHRVGGYMSNFDRGDYRFEISLHAFDGLLNEPLK